MRYSFVCLPSSPLRLLRSFPARPPSPTCRPPSVPGIFYHPFTMKLYRDYLSGDEMFVDTSKFEIVKDAFYMVVGKHITMAEGNIELAGSNASQEEAAEEVDSNSVSGVDVVLHQRLSETQFGSKKDYLAYMKEYMKSLTKKLTELEKTEDVAKLKSIQGPLVELLKNFKDLQFFTGESQDPDGMVVIMDYKEIDGEERPVLYFPLYGCEELKL